MSKNKSLWSLRHALPTLSSGASRPSTSCPSGPAFSPVAPEGIRITIMNQLIIVLGKFQGWIKHQTWCSRCTTNRHSFSELFSARRWRLELDSHALNVKYASLDLVERGKKRQNMTYWTWLWDPRHRDPASSNSRHPSLGLIWGRWRLRVYPSVWLVPLLQM